MKKLSIKTLSIVLLTSTMFFSSCKKGDPGPAGTDGNANVTQINFSSKTIPAGGTITLTLPGITKAIAEKSMILTYGKVNGQYWYQLPGYGFTGTHEYRTFIEPLDPSTTINISMIVGTSAETFDPIRVLVIPANTIVTGRGTTPPFDISDYESVRNYFNLPE